MFYVERVIFMKQTVYCDRFYCTHFADGKCTSPCLHILAYAGCKEFQPSAEKLEAHLKPLRPDLYPEKEPGSYD